MCIVGHTTPPAASHQQHPTSSCEWTMANCVGVGVKRDDETSHVLCSGDDESPTIASTTLPDHGSRKQQQTALDADPLHERTSCGIATPTRDATIFRLQKCSTKIFGLSPVSEISAALHCTGLDTPKLRRTGASPLCSNGKDKFLPTDENNSVASSGRGASSRAQPLKDCTIHQQNIDNVGGNTKDDGSSRWQHQQEQPVQQQEDEGTLNSSRFTLNSASQSPASRRAEQRQRSVQRRQHAMPQRMIYDESKLLELGSPGKENLLPSEELSFYDSHSPQSHSPRPCSPSMLCPEDALGGGELLPSESNTPSSHMLIPLGSKAGPTATAANVGIKMAPLGYRLRRPLDDHDPNSMDSGYGASVLNDALLNSLNNGSTVANGASNNASGVSAASKCSTSMFHFHSSASSASISRHSSASSPTSSRRLLHSSLSSGSMESMDDMELFDMEAIEEQDSHQLADSLYQAPVHQQQQQHQPTLLPSGLNTLICGTIKTTHTATTPEQKRPFVRRCLSLNENASNQLPASPLASGSVAGAAHTKTPERFSRRAIAMDDQENCTPFASRSAMEVTRCFKRPEPPGVSPVQSKRYKTTQLDAPALAAEATAAVLPPSVNALDSPARTTVLAAVPKKPVYQKSISMNDAQIMTALSRSSSEPDLIGDFSKSYVLPLMKGQHRDLKSISGETMARLLHGAFDEKVESFKIIDCRYPYEFEGGHIRGAKNLYTQEQIIDELIKSKNEPPQVVDQENGALRRHIIVFHCEFSSERGPKLSRFLRNHDRILNENSYPALYYPEMYLLHGGYKEFFNAHADLCDPIAYRPMLDPEYGDAYRHFRAKSRSWNGDGTGTVKASATASSLTTGIRLTKSRSRLML